MRPIRWLHISDIHMRPRDAWSQDVVLRAMCQDVELHRADLAIDFVLISGDLAYSGKPKEYALVSQFFNALAAAAVLAPVAVDRSPSPPRSWAKTAGSPQVHLSDARDRREGLRQARV